MSTFGIPTTNDTAIPNFSSSSSSATSTSSNYTSDQMDILSVVFFVLAGVWLLAALLYSAVVLLFLKLRSSGRLQNHHNHSNNNNQATTTTRTIVNEDGTVSTVIVRIPNRQNRSNTNIENDETFGRLYITSRFYIPLGCLLRMYLRHIRYDADNNAATLSNGIDPAFYLFTSNDAIPNGSNSRPKSYHFMTRPERRAAMEKLLMSSSSDKTKSTVTKEQTSKKSLDDEAHAHLDETENSESFRDGDDDDDDIEIGIRKIPIDDDDDDKRSVTSDNTVSNAPICSICLGEYGTTTNCDDSKSGLSTTPIPDTDANIENDYELMYTEQYTEPVDPSMTKFYQSSTCSHHFHQGCILDWLQRQNNINCPCCRIPMVTEEDVYQTVKKTRREKKRRYHQRMKQKKRQLQQQQNRTTTGDMNPYDEYHHSLTNDWRILMMSDAWSDPPPSSRRADPTASSSLPISSRPSTTSISAVVAGERDTEIGGGNGNHDESTIRIAYNEQYWIQQRERQQAEQEQQATVTNEVETQAFDNTVAINADADVQIRRNMSSNSTATNCSADENNDDDKCSRVDSDEFYDAVYNAANALSSAREQNTNYYDSSSHAVEHATITTQSTTIESRNDTTIPITTSEIESPSLSQAVLFHEKIEL